MKRPCNYPGCPNTIEGHGVRFCATHKHKRASRRNDYDNKRRKLDASLALSARIRSSARWQRTRKQKLYCDPLCEDPLKLHGSNTVTATQVHHVKPLTVHPELAYHMDNLQSVCTKCHAKIEASERRKQQSTMAPRPC